MGTCQPELSNNFGFRQIEPNVIENLVTGEQMEHFVVEASADEYYEFKEVYELRSTPVPPFVQVYNFSFEEGWSKNTIHVYTQRIIRLPNLELSIPEAVFLLKQAIIGFRLLFEQFGPFTINNKMIGVNLNGRPKVWINENFAMNDISMEITDFITEQDVVYSLAALIEDQLDDDHLSNYFNPYMGRLNFNIAIKVLESVQASQPVKVKKVFLDNRQYSAYLSQQLSSSASVQVTTTTTTTVVPQQVMQQYAPTYVQPEISPIYLQVQDVSNNGHYNSRGNQYYALTPSGNQPTAQPYRVMTPPPQNFAVKPQAIKQIRPYSKIPLQQNRQRRQHDRPIAPAAGYQEFVRPIRAVNRQPNLKRVMPTTERNQVEKAMEKKHKEDSMNIPLYESVIVVEKV